MHPHKSYLHPQKNPNLKVFWPEAPILETCSLTRFVPAAFPAKISELYASQWVHGWLMESIGQAHYAV